MAIVKDIMTSIEDIIMVSPDMEVTNAAKVLVENQINGAPVVDERGELVGIICQSDLVAQQKQVSLPSYFSILGGFIPLSLPKKFEEQIQKIAAMTVADAMTKDPVTVKPETTIEEVAALMVNRKFHTLPVTAQGELVGIVGKEDVLKSLLPESA